METTNASAASGGDCNVATPQAPLNVGLDSINLLRWTNKLVIEDVAVAGRFRGWREHSPTEGEQWLRRSAEDGDFYAMESLGLRLFNGEGLGKAREQGLAWLKKSAELGNPIAMTTLADCLLEMESSSDSNAEAERWLQRSIECGNKQAAVILGSRLIVGAGTTSNPERGKQLLREAAQGGSQLAHIKLGVYLLSGQGLRQDREEGLRWLRRVGATEANHMSHLAYYAYMKSLAAPTKRSTRILAEEAAILFQEAIQLGNEEEKVNLAYLLRRGEISRTSYPSIEKLLATHVYQENPAALINQALRVAAGIECTADWQVADILVSKIQSADAILSWWFARSEEGDPEGHLVTGWLVRHRLALDPDQIPLAQRMNLARRGGWPVPAWMNQLAGPPDSDAGHGHAARIDNSTATRQEPTCNRDWTSTNRYRCVLETQPDALVPPALRSHRALNGHSWIVNPLLRFSDNGRCPADHIPFAEGVASPEPMAWVSDPVTSVVSPFVLGPELTRLVSRLRPGYELAEPLPPETRQLLAEGGLIYDPDAKENERHAWHTSLERAQARFESGYVALGAVLHPFTLSAMRIHFGKLIQQGGAHYGDRLVPRRWTAHNEPAARFMLHQLTSIVETIAGVPLKPSYVYFASYYDGAKLARHTDREQCEYSISMLVDYSPEPESESPWPLWLDTESGPVAIHQCLGDTLIYRGRQLPHFREQLPAGHTSTHLFLHYVPRDFAGPLD